MIQYKTVPVNPMQVVKKGTHPSKIVAPFARIIESEAVGGWKYHSALVVETKIKKKGLAALIALFTGNKYLGTMTHYALVFVKED